MKFRGIRGIGLGLALVAVALVPGTASAHCDTMDGPVVQDAVKALGAKDVTPVLKWVKPDAEPDIRAAFEKTLAARATGKAAKEVVDQWFFETLVRVHRAGEGAPFTGVKPSGTEVDPGLVAADRALEGGSIDAVAKELGDAVARGVRERFARVTEAKAHADHNVEAGRRFVAGYVDYIHYVERLHQVASQAPAAQGHHEHH